MKPVVKIILCSLVVLLLAGALVWAIGLDGAPVISLGDGNDKMLRQVKGIGPKAAQRIIVDLRDKIASLGIEASGSAASGSGPDFDKEVMDEAIQALTMLGFSPAPAGKVVRQILSEEPGAPVERVIKLALKML